MKNLKKLSALLLSCLLLTGCALAEENAASEATANGVVEAMNTYDLLAPFSGTLLSFDYDRGATVTAGDVIFRMDTTKVYAPATGKIGAVFAQVGESAADVTAQYGMLAAIEKSLPLTIVATKTGAYDDKETLVVHVGEVLHYRRTKDTEDKGTARVIAVSADGYTLEVLTGDYKVGDEVALNRDSEFNKKQNVGKGTIARAADVAVNGTGRVLKCYAEEGAAVERGQLLFELAADAEPSVTSADVAAPINGVLDTAKVQSGQQVYKGQLLATLHDPSALQVVAEVDEMDLGDLQSGDTVTLEFDRFPKQRVQGIVSSISGLGSTKQNAAYYDVRVTFTSSMNVLVGMSATVYLPAAK